MLNVTVENIGELAVVECEGKIVQSEAAFKLRKAVNSRRCTPSKTAVSARWCICADGRETTISVSCCSIPPGRSVTD